MSNIPTSSYIYKHGTTGNTRAVNSQKSKLFGYAVGNNGFQQIGVVSEFSFDESRAVDPVRGIGFGDQIAELVPGMTEPMSITLSKTMLYTVNMFQVLGYKGGIDGLVRSLKHHRWPFDLKHEIVISELSTKQDPNGTSVDATVLHGPTSADEPIVTPQCLLTYYEGCWFQSYTASFSADQAMVAEQATILVSDIVDGVSQYGEYLDTGLAPVSPGAPGKGFSLRFSSDSASVSTFPTP